MLPCLDLSFMYKEYIEIMYAMVPVLLFAYRYVHNMVMMSRRIIFNLFRNWKQYLISEENRVVVIPLDLVMEIMSYTAVGDVLRCKSVCKSWRDVLSSPRFVNLHVSRAQVFPISSLVLRDNDCRQLRPEARLAWSDSMDSCVFGMFAVQGMDISRLLEDRTLCRLFRLPPPPDLKCCYNLIASHNGLFVIRESDNSYYIKNPALCKRIRLPHLPLLRPNKAGRMQLYHVPSTNQYKLVACCVTLDSRIMGLWILTIGEDQTWRHLGDCWAHECTLSKDAPHLFRSFYIQFYHDFPYSYLFHTKDKVLTFDVDSEQLIDNELPKEMKRLERGLTVFSEGWKGCTAIIFYNEDIVRVFILEDYKRNKWVSKSLIHGGFVNRLRELRHILPNYSCHVLTDDEDRLWFQVGHEAYFCHLETQQIVTYNFKNYGFGNCVCPSKFTLETCKGMQFPRV